MKKNKVESIEKETKAVVTTVIGSFRCSVSYYLCKVLTDLNLKTLVIDNTSKNELFRILKKDTSDEILKRNNTFYVKNRNLTREDFEEFDKSFDNVIVLIGSESTSFERDVLDRTDHFVFMTGYDRFSRDEFKETMRTLYAMDKSYLSDKTHSIQMVWNDKCPCKVIEKDFESRCNISVTNRHYIKTSDSNRKAYISLTESGYGKISVLSQDFKECISKICDTITENKHSKQIKKLCK